MEFYRDTLATLLDDGKLDRAAPTLVVAGGETDRVVLSGLGFTDVTISNLDERMQADAFAPYRWRFLDGEDLDLPDGAFAQVIEHMGLHHCASPHRGLLEMYRVASRAVVMFENRDSLAMRAAIRAGFVPRYEFEAVEDHGFAYGGQRNTGVPNAVYRWTERDVEAALASYDPAHDVPVRYFYGLRLPTGRIEGLANPLARGAMRASLAPFRLAARLFPKQANQFGVFIDKGARTLHPWMEDGERLRRDFRETVGWR